MPLLRRSSVRRRVLRGGRRVRRRLGVTRGRGIGLRSRRMAVRLGPRTESKYVDTNGQIILSNIAPRGSTITPSLSMTEYLPEVVSGRVIPLLFSGIPQGPSATQRIGNRVFVRNIRMSMILNAAQLVGANYAEDQYEGKLNNNGAITENPGIWSGTGAFPQKYIRTTFRLVVLRDRMVSLTGSVPAAPLAPSIDDVFESGGALYTTANLNVSSLGRYQLLYDRKFTCDSDDPQRSMTANISLNAPSHFGGAGATDVREGALYFLAFAASGGIDAVGIGSRFWPPALGFSWRVAYTDR